MDEKEFDEKAFRSQYMLDLKGKAYLPVAPRVFLARKEHPDWTFETEFRMLNGDPHVFARISDTARTLATAHKRVRADGKGPAAAYPVETAETGALGRALAMCGYGTMSGDLDEGDQISDAPVSRSDNKWR